MTRTFTTGWLQVLACMIVAAVSTGTISSSYSIVAVVIGRTFEPSRMMQSLAMTVLALSMGVLSPVIGAALDRRSIRHLMFAGGACLGLGWFALSFATSMIQVLLIYGVLMAIAITLLSTLALSTLLSRWFVRKRGWALGLAAIGTSVGGMVFPFAIQELITAFDWRMAFRILAGLVFLIVTATALFLVVDRPADRGLYPDGDDGDPSATGEAPMPVLRSIVPVLRDADFWMVALVVVILLGGSKGLVSNLAPLALDRGIASGSVPSILSAMSLGGLVAHLLFGAISERIPHRVIIMFLLLLEALAMLCFRQAQTLPLLIAGAACLGFAAGSTVPLWGVLLASRYGPQNLGRVMGAMTLALTPLNLLVPPLFGWTYDRTGAYSAALTLFIVIAVLAVALVPRLCRRDLMIA